MEDREVLLTAKPPSLLQRRLMCQLCQHHLISLHFQASPYGESCAIRWGMLPMQKAAPFLQHRSSISTEQQQPQPRREF